MTSVKIFPTQADALDDENLVRAVLAAHGWDLSVHYSIEPVFPFHRITASAPDAPFDVIAEWVCQQSQWSRRMVIEWHLGGAYPWPVGEDLPFDTILDLKAPNPVASEAQLAQLCRTIDPREVA